MIEFMCDCGNTYRRYNSLQRKCPKCSYNINAAPRKRISRIGPVTRKLIEQRNQWIEDNPPDAYGNYVCMYCDQTVHIDVFNLEHKYSKARHPELRLTKSNLGPSCSFDNERKGSMDYNEYIAKYYPHKILA